LIRFNASITVNTTNPTTPGGLNASSIQRDASVPLRNASLTAHSGQNGSAAATTASGSLAESGSADAGSGSGESFSGDTSSGDFGSGSGVDSKSASAGLGTNGSEIVTSALGSVDVTLNGRQFTASGLPFMYFGTPVVSAVSPACGPVIGGTIVRVTGYHLRDGSAYRCRFGAVTVNASVDETASEVRCVAPSSLPMGLAPLEVSLNAQDFTTEATLFGTYASPLLTAFEPRSGPVYGGTLVRVVHGSGPGCDHRCAFGNGSETVVHGGGNSASTATVCVAPPLSAIQRHAAGDGGASHAVEVLPLTVLERGPVLVLAAHGLVCSSYDAGRCR
jgi:hypothetical protein